MEYVELTKEDIGGYKSIRGYVQKHNINHIFKNSHKGVLIDTSVPNNASKVFVRKEDRDTIKNKYDVKAYPSIYLEDHEKFRDEEGNILEIKISGERTPEGIYFKVTDVERAFKISRIHSVMTNKTSTFVRGVDFDNINIIDDGLTAIMNHVSGQIESNRIKSTAHLTYRGLLKLLFTVRNNKATHFINYSIKLLFIHQFGDEVQKNKLISDMKYIPYESIQSLFNANANTTPCIYLSSFGRVSDLRTTMNIPDIYNDNDVVYKFGRTKDITQRKDGHKTEYKELIEEAGVTLKLVKYSFIDPLYTAQAETELKDNLSGYLFPYKSHKEIVIIPNIALKTINSTFSNISKKYSGHLTEMKQQIEELNNEVNRLQIINDNITSRHEEEIKNIKIIHDKEIQLLEKEINNMKDCNKLQIENYKLQIENYKLQNETLKNTIINNERE